MKNNNFKRNLLISSIVSLLVLTISSTASYISIKKLLDSVFWVNHTQKVIYNLNEGSALITDAQTNMRGYLITGNEDFINKLNEAQLESNTFFDEIEKLTVDNPLQQKALKDLKILRTDFFKYLETQINNKRLGKQVFSFDLNGGKIRMDELRRNFRRIENNEQILLKDRNEKAELYGDYSSILIITAFIVAFIISIIFLIRILKDFNVRSQLQHKLELKDKEIAERIEAISTIATNISNGNYDIKVEDTKSDSLSSVGESLNNMSASLKKSFNLLSEKEWIQTGIAKLNDVMLGDK